jgi:nitroreductase
MGPVCVGIFVNYAHIKAKLMELKNAIESRTSVRTFLNDDIPESDIRELVRLAGLAPSVNNFQPWSFILLKNKKTLNLISQMVSVKLSEMPSKGSKADANIRNQVEWYSTFFKDAPAVIAVILDKYESVLEKGVDISHDRVNEIRNFPDIQSAGACIQNLLLAAVDMGYGACWLSGPMVARKEIEHLIGVKAPSLLLSFVAIGKPSKEFKPKEKEDLGKKLRVVD